MTDLEWTDEPPEEPGWYWHRTHDQHIKADDQIQCLREEYGKVYALRKTQDEGVQEAPVTNDIFEDDKWAGPIPEPAEPDE